MGDSPLMNRIEESGPVVKPLVCLACNHTPLDPLDAKGSRT